MILLGYPNFSLTHSHVVCEFEPVSIWMCITTTQWLQSLCNSDVSPCLTGITAYNHTTIYNSRATYTSEIHIRGCGSTWFWHIQRDGWKLFGQIVFVAVPVLRSCGYPFPCTVGSSFLSSQLPRFPGHWWTMTGTLDHSQSTDVVDGISSCIHTYPRSSQKQVIYTHIRVFHGDIHRYAISIKL